MRCRLFNILSAVSLAIFAAALVLGARSYWKLDYLTFYPNPEHQICCCTRVGLIDFSSGWRVPEERGGPWGLPPGYAVGDITADSGSVWKLMPYRRRYDEDHGRTITEYQFLGFESAWGYYPTLQQPYCRMTDLVVPLWFALTTSSLLPTIWAIRRVQRSRRETDNLCRACGYDLRATPGGCPECGAVPKRGM